MEKDIITIGLRAEIENIDEIEQQIKELQDKLSNMQIILRVVDGEEKSNIEDTVAELKNVVPTESKYTLEEFLKDLSTKWECMSESDKFYFATKLVGHRKCVKCVDLLDELNN